MNYTYHVSVHMCWLVLISSSETRVYCTLAIEYAIEKSFKYASAHAHKRSISSINLPVLQSPCDLSQYSSLCKLHAEKITLK